MVALIDRYFARAPIVGLHNADAVVAVAVAVGSGKSAQRMIPESCHSCCNCRIAVVGGLCMFAAMDTGHFE